MLGIRLGFFPFVGSRPTAGTYPGREEQKLRPTTVGTGMLGVRASSCPGPRELVGIRTAPAQLSWSAAVPRCLRAGPAAHVLPEHGLSSDPPASWALHPLQGFRRWLSSFCIPSLLSSVLPKVPGCFPCSSAPQAFPKVFPGLAACSPPEPSLWGSDRPVFLDNPTGP